MGRRVSGGTGSNEWGIRLRRWLVPVAALALVFGVLPATPALAAGSGVLTVTPTIVHPSSGAILTSVDPTDGSLGGRYRVDFAFSCLSAACDGTTVTVAANPKDPYYNYFVLETAGYTFTPPFAGATASGSPAAGITVNLGNLSAGVNGVFQIYYNFRDRPGIPVPGSAASFFPNGWTIPASATIQSPTATGPATGATSATWVTRSSAATLATSAPTSTRTDTAITVSANTASGCNFYSGYNLGIESATCAKSNVFTTQLPPDAQYVAGSATAGGVYDPVARTVTWTNVNTPNPAAAYGGATYTAARLAGGSFQVTFPSSAFPTTGAGCVVNETFTTTAQFVMLDGQVQNPATSTATVQAQNCAPFGGMTPANKISTFNAGTGTAPIVYIPASGQPATAREWMVSAGNTANVAGVMTIVDNGLDQADMPVYQIYNPSAAGTSWTLSITLKDSANAVSTASATLASGGTYYAPTGSRVVGVTATSSSLIGPNAVSTNQSKYTAAYLTFRYAVYDTATAGTRTNTADVTMSYPGYSLAPVTATASRTVTLQDTPATLPQVNIGVGGPGVVPAGSNIVPGSTVQWVVYGSVTLAPNNNTIVPQYVFIAPPGWDITGTTWATAPPAGTTVVQRQVMINGVQRNLVVATWPAAISIGGSGSSGSLPSLWVNTTPTMAAPAGANIATLLVGDANHGLSNFNTAPYTESADLTGDGTTGDKYAGVTLTANVTGTPALTLLKEICRPDGFGGCMWIADPNVLVGVEPSATSIKYRVTITNSGTAQVNNVVAYDVLPYVGDSGTSDATVGTPRGSTVTETLNAVSGVPGDVTLAYSTSTNPPRPGVFSAGTTGDWTAPASGASSLRASIVSLQPGESRSFTYEAGLVGGSADQIACNSVASIATSLSAVEPSAVCATTQEADLSVAGASRFPLQVGRVGTVPFVVNNGGGSQLATGTVTIDVPAGLTIETLTIPNWNCSAPAMTGPVVVTCDPVDGGGDSRQLQLNVPETISLQLTPDATVNGDELCFDASITGIMSDPVLANNEATVCSTVFDDSALFSVSKTDGVTEANVGDTLTYTITATNEIVDQGLLGVVVTDTLPAGVEWVSGGTVTGQDADGLGGTVSFPAVDLAAAGTATTTGDDGTSNAGSTVTFTVTVRVAATATGDIVNTTTGNATDPLTALPLTDTDTDTDGLRKLTVTKSSNAAAAGVREGDTVTYTIVLTNDGTSAYTAGSPASVLDDLTGVLDDATYVSGTVTVAGAPSAITPNASQQLVWSGALAAGASAVLTYSVTVGPGADELLTNTVFASGEPGTCVNGSDANGISCATVQSVYAPLIGKRITSLTQEDNGTWTIVYAVDVTNPSPVGTSTYDLSDALQFGAGIQVLSASATVPAGVTAALPAWSGTGPIATGVSIAAGAQHTYTITVNADAHQVAGTAAATCVTGVAGGFANEATIELAGIADTSAEACASPVAPTIQKSVGAALQQADGSWNVVYTVTVRNTNASPADLAYTVEDALDFAAGTTVNTVQVSGPDASATFDGSADRMLLTGVGRIPAPTGGQTFTNRVYTVTVNVDAPVGAVDAADLLCTPTGGGYANTATLLAGTGGTVLGTASACAPITVAPLPVISKEVVSSSVDIDGAWTVTYEIDVQNPDGVFGTIYDLDDELDLAAGVTVNSVTVSQAPPGVTPDASWNGVGVTTIAQDVALPAGQTHTYRVTLVADPGSLDPESALADCRIDSGETGTGFRNLATVTAGVSTAFDDACEPFTDPSVVKTTVGVPTQDPDTGIWTLEYDLTVTNKSTSTTGTIPFTLSDTIAFPADVDIVDIAVAAPSGATVNTAFDGSTVTDLGSGDIGAAVDEFTPATKVFTVTVQFTVAAGIAAGTQCDPAQGPGGLRNEVEIGVGPRLSGSVACADVPDVPAPTVSKTVLSYEQQADGTWLVLYRVTVANPSGTAASEYTLDDSFALGDGMTLDSTPTIVAKPDDVTVNPTWNGDDQTTIAEEIILPAAGSHTYTVRAVIDAGTVTGEEPAGDCVLDAGEAGTGFGNTATVDTGVVTSDASICAQAWDPGVTKEIAGVPTQQADGSWLLSYTMTVTNPSAVPLSYGLVDELHFPAGTVVTVESAAGRPGSPTVEPDWDGATQLQLVADGTPLPANAVHVFDVTVRALLPEDQESQDGGWVNSATVESGVGGVITTEAEEATDILIPELVITKNATPSESFLRIGDTIEYEIDIENVGDGEFTGLYPAVVWDALADVLDDATLDAAPIATPGIGAVATNDGGYGWSGPLPSGDRVTLTYSVTITGEGDANLVNVAFVGQPTETDPTVPDPADCADPLCATTETPLAALEVTKTVDATNVAPGSKLHYEVTVTNTGHADIPESEGVTVTDDLSDVLDDASYNGDTKADIGTVEIMGTVLSWTGGLAVGESATITYSVTVSGDAATGATLVNRAVSDPTLPSLALGGGGAQREATTTSTVQRLALTGFTIWWLAPVLSLLLLSGGAALVILRRRQRAAESV